MTNYKVIAQPAKENAIIYYEILSTYSSRKRVQISLENLQ